LSTPEELHAQIQLRLFEKLSEAEQKHRKLVETLRVVILQLDAQDRITFLNKAWSDQLGYSIEASLGKSLADFTVESDQEESSLRHADGHLVWFEVLLQETEYGGKFGVLHNIDVRRRVEQQLTIRENESRRLALVASRTHNAVIITDASVKIVWVNDAFTRITGYMFDEVIGRSPGSVLQGPLTDSKTVEEMRNQIKSGLPFQTEILNYRKDGSTYWLEIDVQPIRDESGNIIQYIAVEQDITARKVYQEQLVEQAERLAEQSRLAALRAEVGIVLNQDKPLRTLLAESCDIILKHTDAAFVRVWTLEQNAEVLELQASRGLYTHLDGQHSRIPVGAFKIGFIAATAEPILTNQVIGNPRVPEQEWAKREGMVAFAGHPLILAGQVVGVLGLFSRKTLNQPVLEALQVVADTLALGIVRHTSQKQLMLSEARFRTFVEKASDGFFIHDAHGLILDVNRAACQSLGYTSQELIGKSLSLVDLDFTEARALEIQEHLDHGELAVFDSRYQRKDGTTFPADVRIQPFQQDSRQLALTVVRDITQRVKDERALRVSEARQRAVIESALDCIISIDRESRIVEFNPAAESTFGYLRKDILGKPLDTLIIPPQHRQAHHAGMDRFLSTGVSRILGQRLVGLPALRADGSTILIELTVMKMELDADPVFTAFLRDITKEQESESKQRQAMLEIERAREEAVAADRAKSLFLANMSHEVRTPMAAVVGYAEMLLDPRLGTEQRMSIVNAINRNGRHLLALINEVLDLSKIEAGQLELESVPCRVWQTIEEAMSVAGVAAQDQKVQLAAVVRGQIPRIFHTDPTRFRQILDNLLSNAVKFTPSRKSIELRVFMFEGNSPRLVIEVEDQGIGINPEVISKLFRPFTQADPSTTRKFGGTGLGLSITWKLVKAFNGEITVRSEPGVGTCFTVMLPLKPEDLLELVSESEMSQESQLIRQSRSPKVQLIGNVLLAEDNPDSRNIIGYFLEKAGLTVERVENGLLALERATRKEYDVILMDMQMPEMDGYTATSTLRQQGYTRSILALTAHAMAGDEEKCLRAGCNAYLTKPVEAERLINLVSRLLPARTWRFTRDKIFRQTSPDSGRIPIPQSEPVLNNDADGTASLTIAYRKALPEKAKDMQRLLERGQFKELAAAAHKLRGSAGMYGFPELSETAGLLEDACTEGQSPDLLRELLAELTMHLFDAASGS
jgi:PAS domain S-box-containing protein